MINNGVTSPKGFKASGVACGLKKNGQNDLALVVSDNLATAAGIFTTNVVKGHSLQWSRKNILRGTANAVVINSGCANACVGPQGDEDAKEMAIFTSKLVGCNAEDVMLGSTGVIGFRLDMDKIRQGISDAYNSLSEEGGAIAAKAIMTTDTFPKEASKTLIIDNKTVTIGGMAKGSGMIHPNMATMISVLTTDISISQKLLDKALREASDCSYNRVCVDGDTSVCDKVLILANGLAANTPIEEEGPMYNAFVKALKEVCITLAKMLAKDGEGATKLIEICVEHCKNKDDAHLILNAIAKSPLVKTAMFGQDANWGRIFTAAGYSGAQFDAEKVNIFLGDLLVCKNGVALPFDEVRALEILKENEILITLDFNTGDISDRIYTCDLSFDYVKINGSYRS